MAAGSRSSRRASSFHPSAAARHEPGADHEPERLRFGSAAPPLGVIRPPQAHEPLDPEDRVRHPRPERAPRPGGARQLAAFQREQMFGNNLGLPAAIDPPGHRQRHERERREQAAKRAQRRGETLRAERDVGIVRRVIRRDVDEQRQRDVPPPRTLEPEHEAYRQTGQRRPDEQQVRQRVGGRREQAHAARVGQPRAHRRRAAGHEHGGRGGVQPGPVREDPSAGDRARVLRRGGEAIQILGEREPRASRGGDEDAVGHRPLPAHRRN
jgi:hypothetical protein